MSSEKPPAAQAQTLGVEERKGSLHSTRSDVTFSTAGEQRPRHSIFDPVDNDEMFAAKKRRRRSLRSRCFRTSKAFFTELRKPAHLLTVVFGTVFCVTCGVLLFVFMRQSDVASVQSTFESTSNDLSRYSESYLRRTMSEDMGSVRAAMTFRRPYYNVSASDFLALFSARGGVSKGVQAVQWAPHVTSQTMRTDLVTRARIEQSATFNFIDRAKPTGFQVADTRSEYYPVYFIEPMAGNSVVLGLDDLANDTSRRAAIYGARDTGTFSCTPPVILAQTGSFGLICYLAAYESIGIPATVPDRQNSIIGVATGVFQISKLFNQICDDVSSSRTRLELTVYDSARGKLYNSETGGLSVLVGGSPSDVKVPSSLSSAMRMEKTLAVGDRTWTLVTVAKESWVTDSLSALPLMVLLIFLGLMLLIWGFVALRVRHDMIAAKHAKEKQSLVDRLLPVPVGRVLVEKTRQFEEMWGPDDSATQTERSMDEHNGHGNRYDTRSIDGGMPGWQTTAAAHGPVGRRPVQPPILLEIPFSCIIFLDLVGFTGFSTKRDARIVVDLLYDLFMSLDEVMEHTQAIKLRTIGDAVLASTGLFPTQHSITAEQELERRRLMERYPNMQVPPSSSSTTVMNGSNSDSAQDLESGNGNSSVQETSKTSSKVSPVVGTDASKSNVDRFNEVGELVVKDSPMWRRAVLRAAFRYALEARATALRVFDEHGFANLLNVRIGIHCGPVVGAVIGLQRPFFDVFGNTVNIASRMESSSMPGLIHLSEDVVREWESVRGPCGDTDFMYEQREGTVSLKGVGEVHSYWLHGYGMPA